MNFFKKTCLIFLPFLLNISILFAQNHEIDSLVNLIDKASGETKIDLLNSLALKLADIKPEKGLQKAKEALQLSQELNLELKEGESFLAISDVLLEMANDKASLDSLNKAYAIFKEVNNTWGLAKANLSFGNIYSDRGDFDESLVYYKKSLELFQSLDNKKGLSMAYNNLGYVYSRQSEYELSLENHLKSLVISEEMGHKEGIAYTYYNIGVINDLRGNFDKSLEAFINGLKLFEEIGNLAMVSSSYNSLGIIHEGQEMYGKALEYYQKSLELKERVGDKRGIGYTLSNMGELHFDLGNYQKALELQERGLEIRKENNDKYGIATSFHFLGLINTAIGKNDQALDYFNKSVELRLETGDKEGLADSYMGLATLFIQTNNPEKALLNLQKGEKIAREIGAKEVLKDILEKYAKAHYQLKNYQKAFDYQRKFTSLKDSIFNIEKSKQFAEINTKYETEKKDNELAVQELKISEQQAVLSNQKLLILIVVIVFVAVGLLAFLIFNRYKLKQKNQKLALENEQIKLSQNLKTRKDTDDIINYFATSLYGKNSVEDILWDVAQNCISKLGLKDCVIYLVDEEKKVLVQKAAYGIKDSGEFEVHEPLEIPIGKGIVGAVAENGIAEVVQDTQEDDRYIEDTVSGQSELAVPLIFQQKVIGVIDSEHHETGFFQQQHLDALKTIASICSSKIAQAQADEKAQQAKLAQLEAEQIKALDQVKSRFFANISHEFRTPLNLILGPLQSPEGEIPVHLQQMMKRNAQRLLRLVNQLLDLAKLEVGELKINYQKGDIFQYLRTLTSSFSSMAEARNINYMVNIPEQKLEAGFDPDKLEKIIYNLLANAIKFTPDGGTVEINGFIEANTTLVYTVKDSGIGIPDTLQSKIFDRFYQADNSQTRAYEGTGIGLALTKELVQLHKGLIYFESKEGEGSTFTIKIPLKSSENLLPATFHLEEIEKIEVPNITTTPTVKNEDKLLVLIVEDNQDLRAYIKENLAEKYNCLEAVNGEKGLKTAIEKVPDLVISDVMMPVMDGLTFTDKLKNDQRTSHIPVIMLTARDDKETKKSGFLKGADQYVTKPFDIEELHVRIEGLISQRNKLKEKFSKEITLQPKEVLLNDFDAEFLEKAMKVVEENLGDFNFSVEQMQLEMGMSRMQLHRKLKALTDQSTSEFIRKIRLQRAAQLFHQPGVQVAEVAYQVGFTHLSYFAKCFKEQYGSSPSTFVEKISNSH